MKKQIFGILVGLGSFFSVAQAAETSWMTFEASVRADDVPCYFNCTGAIDGQANRSAFNQNFGLDSEEMLIASLRSGNLVFVATLKQEPSVHTFLLDYPMSGCSTCQIVENTVNMSESNHLQLSASCKSVPGVGCELVISAFPTAKCI